MIKQLQNTLYIQAQGTYARIEQDTVRVDEDGKTLLKIPLHHLGSLVLFGNVLASPYLIQRCAEDQRNLTWFSQSGRFKGRLTGPTSGNVLLRRAQHLAHGDTANRLELARRFVLGKVANCRHILLRGMRDGPETDALSKAAELLKTTGPLVEDAPDLDKLMGIEGNAANAYFDAFPDMLRRDEDWLRFTGRNRRPPRDPVNALLSFTYTLLGNECAGALDGVGLDPQVGFLHALRPGRASLALDLMEEFRPSVADRLVLTLLNRQQLGPDDFETRPGGAVYLTEDGRRTFLQAWQKRKQEEVHHAVLDRRVPIGLLPHVQARLLARTLRGDLGAYPYYKPR